MTKIPAIFDFPEDINVEVEDETATLITSGDKWYITLTNAYAHIIGTRGQDVRMVEIINNPDYLDESYDGEICKVTGKLSIIKEKSTFIMKGISF